MTTFVFFSFLAIKGDETEKKTTFQPLRLGCLSQYSMNNRCIEYLKKSGGRSLSIKIWEKISTEARKTSDKLIDEVRPLAVN
jgi:hypothetical protein